MGTHEDCRHGSPHHAGEGVIGSATPLACSGFPLRLGRVPPGSCAPWAWAGRRPAEALQGFQGLASEGFASELAAARCQRWRRGVADASDDPARLCSSHLLSRPGACPPCLLRCVPCARARGRHATGRRCR